MARLARVEIFRPDEIAIVHVMNRTVRRCFLLGDDPLTGKNYDHRKEWLETQLVRLAAQFGIDLLCQAIMSNHFHLVLRSRPDVVAEWNDTEVARRWLMLCPVRKDAQGQAEEPSEAELNSIRKNKKKLEAIRSRLSDISWWMRLLSQNIAQRTTATTRRWENSGKRDYRAVRLLDETSLLACAAYVDLNPIRAAMTETLEESEFTSIQKRIQTLKTVLKGQKRVESGPGSKTSQSDIHSLPDGYLAPLEINERRDKAGPCCHRGGRRCSDKGFLPMPMAAYISLLDWTARQVRSDKRGRTPDKMKPIFERLQISGEVWCELVKNFGRLFYAVAGKPHEIDARRSRDGRRRYKAKRAVRELLAA